MAIVYCIFMSASGQQTADDWNQQGIAFAQTGKYDEAIQAFDKAIAINSSYADPWSNKATALYSHGNYIEAIQAYDKALELKPDAMHSAYIWNSKGLALYKQGKYGEAIPDRNLSSRTKV